MICRFCGEIIPDDSKFCPNCGANVEGQKPVNNPETFQKAKPVVEVNDDGSVGYFFLGFFVPIAGIILFFIWRDTKPQSGKKALNGSLTSIILGILLSIIYAVIFVLAASRGYIY